MCRPLLDKLSHRVIMPLLSQAQTLAAKASAQSFISPRLVDTPGIVCTCPPSWWLQMSLLRVCQAHCSSLPLPVQEETIMQGDTIEYWFVSTCTGNNSSFRSTSCAQLCPVAQDLPGVFVSMVTCWAADAMTKKWRVQVYALGEWGLRATSCGLLIY